MNQNTTIIVVALATVLGGATALPQACRLVLTRQVAGVSSTWAGISVAVNSWWIAYGIGIADRAIVPVAVVSVFAYFAIAASLIRFSIDRRSTVVAMGVGTFGALLPLPALALGGWPAAGIALGAIYGIQLSPAVIEVYRSHDVAGVAAATWVLTWTEALLWGVYGFPRRDLGLLALAATGMLLSSAVLVRLFLHGTSARCEQPSFRPRFRRSPPRDRDDEPRLTRPARRPLTIRQG